MLYCGNAELGHSSPALALPPAREVLHTNTNTLYKCLKPNQPDGLEQQVLLKALHI